MATTYKISLLISKDDAPYHVKTDVFVEPPCQSYCRLNHKSNQLESGEIGIRIKKKIEEN